MRWMTEDSKWEVWSYEPSKRQNNPQTIYLFEHSPGQLDEHGEPDPNGKIRAVWYPQRTLGRVGTDAEDVFSTWEFIDTDNVTQHEECIRTLCGAEPADLFGLAVETALEAT